MSLSPSFPTFIPLFLFVYFLYSISKLWGTLGAVWIHVFTRKYSHFVSLFQSTVYWNYRSDASLSMHNTRPPPQWLEATPTPCRGQFHVWSTIKRRQRLISGLLVQVRRGLGVGGNISRTRKGLNIVFHTWNLTSSVRDLVTPDIWRWPTDTHMFVCGTPSRLAGPNRKRRGVPSSLVSQISIN